MAAAASPEVSVARKLFAGGAMIASGGIVAKHSFHSWGNEWGLLALAAILAVSGVGLGRRSLASQVVSRGAAWLAFLPTMLVSIGSALNGRVPPIGVSAIALMTGAALLLTRPMLHTKDARAQFSPRVFRHWLLSGATATAATGVAAASLAVTTIHQQLTIPFAAVAAALFASAIGVVRMRSWGIFLGALTSLFLLGWSALVGHHAQSVLLALASAPALLMLVLPVVLARFRSDGPDANVRIAEGLHDGTAYETAQYRIATEVSLDETSEEPARAALRA
jgi:hypothetical protein